MGNFLPGARTRLIFFNSSTSAACFSSTQRQYRECDIPFFKQEGRHAC